MLYLLDLMYLRRELWYLYCFECQCYYFRFQTGWGLVLQVLLESQGAGLQNWEQKY